VPLPQPKVPALLDHSANEHKKAPPWGLCKALTNAGLFIGQSKDFFAASTKLAQAADAAERSF
jgi:hypothetical protein